MSDTSFFLVISVNVGTYVYNIQLNMDIWVQLSKICKKDCNTKQSLTRAAFAALMVLCRT